MLEYYTNYIRESCDSDSNLAAPVFVLKKKVKERQRRMKLANLFTLIFQGRAVE